MDYAHDMTTKLVIALFAGLAIGAVISLIWNAVDDRRRERRKFLKEMAELSKNKDLIKPMTPEMPYKEPPQEIRKEDEIDEYHI